MDNSQVYLKFNRMQRVHATEIFSELAEFFDNEASSLLDIGCGPGDILIEVIAQKLPSKCKIVGVDISDEMVKSANNKFQGEEVEFHQCDISAEFADCVKNLKEDQRTYDVITSAHCFHWVQNHIQALRNISNLLKPKGSVVMFFMACAPIFKIYKKLSSFECYQDYMRDHMDFISPYEWKTNPIDLFTENFSAAGLKAKHLEMREETFDFMNIDEFINSTMAVDPFIKRIPESLKNQYMEDYIKVFGDLTSIENIKSGSKVTAHAHFIVAVLTKY